MLRKGQRSVAGRSSWAKTYCMDVEVASRSWTAHASHGSRKGLGAHGRRANAAIIQAPTVLVSVDKVPNSSGRKGSMDKNVKTGCHLHAQGPGLGTKILSKEQREHVVSRRPQRPLLQQPPPLPRPPLPRPPLRQQRQQRQQRQRQRSTHAMMAPMGATRSSVSALNKMPVGLAIAHRAMSVPLAVKTPTCPTSAR